MTAMDPSRALRVAAYVLVADGLAALYLGGLLGPVGLVVVALAAAVSWWSDALEVRAAGRRALVAATSVVTTVLAVDVTWAGATTLDIFTHLLTAVLVVRLYTFRTPREAREIAFLAFFMLVAVAPVVLSVAFLGLFLVQVIAGTWMLMLRHLLAEAHATATPPPRRPLGLGSGLLGLGGSAVVATLAIAAALFLLIPRIGQAALPLGIRGARMVAGFSDRVALGAFGEIEADTTVVMRVQLPAWHPEQGTPERLPLRWRGMGFDVFDGREWRLGEARHVTLRRLGPGPFPVNSLRGHALLTQEIFLEPIGSEAIFGAPRLVRFAGRSDFLGLDDLGNVTVPAPAARLRYTVDSELEVPDPHAEGLTSTYAPADAGWRARFTQLPPLPPRIATLAHDLTAGATDPYEAALRLTTYLSREYRYTMVLDRATDLSPVDEFLFVRRSGNCEYFAAALAVMLRSLGIPARVVNGFQRGEWNPYGRYFMVRLRDAHSWVEMFVDGSGWVTLDPTPRADADAAAASPPATLWLDALRMRWYRYVVNWSLHDQLSAAGAVRRTASAWRAWTLSRPDWIDVPRGVVATAAAALAALVAVGALRRRPRARVARAMPAFYARALRALARRGLEPAPGETAREFAARVAATAPACARPLDRLTAGYERVRFGAERVDAAEATALAAAAAALESRTKEIPVNGRRP